MNSKYILTFLLACFVMLMWGLGGYDIVDPDGPRFALVAREMLENHQWVMPHRNDYVYPDKPPLFFWCIAFFSYLSGEVNSFTARLPSALSAMGVLFIMFQWVKNKSQNNDDIKLAYLTCFILLTSFLFFYEARMTQIDMLLCFFVTGAMVEGYRLISKERNSVWFMALYMGLGTITKGPIAFMLPIGACAIYIFLNKLEWKSLPWKPVLLSFLIPLTWLAFLLIEVIQKDEWVYLNNLLFKQTVVRYVDSWHHEQPFYYFLTTTLWDFFPWWPIFFMALIVSFKKWRSLPDKTKYAWCICLFVFIFFSIPKGKRNLYVLPVYPFAAYIVAQFLYYYIKSLEFPVFLKWFFKTLFFVFFLLSLTLLSIQLGWLNHFQKDLYRFNISYHLILYFGLSMLLISIAGFLAIRKNSLKYPLRILILLMIILNVFIYHVVMPALDPVRSIRGFMQEVNSITEKSGENIVIGMVDFREGFRFYGNRHIIELNSVNGKSKNGEYGVEKFWELYPKGWLIISKSNWEEYLQKTSVKGKVVYEDVISNNRNYFLVRNNNPFAK